MALPPIDELSEADAAKELDPEEATQDAQEPALEGSPEPAQMQLARVPFHERAAVVWSRCGNLLHDSSIRVTGPGKCGYYHRTCSHSCCNQEPWVL